MRLRSAANPIRAWTAALLVSAQAFSLPAFAAGLGRGKHSLELGYQAGFRIKDRNFVRSRPYFQYTYSSESSLTKDSSSMLNLVASVRGFADTSELRQPLTLANAPQGAGRPDAEFSRELAIRKLSAAVSSGSWKTELGFQEISWGETFGMDVADVVNPRDFRDPLFSSASWTKLPVFALNQQFFIESLTIQGVFTPIPRNLLLPEPYSPFSPSAVVPGIQTTDFPDFGLKSFPRDSEFGGKISYLFPFGLDFGVLGFRHWNRQLLYEISGPTSVAPVTGKVNTYGVTGSYTMGDWVLRLDSIVNSGQPLGVDPFGTVLRSAVQHQTVVQADLLRENWSLGLQQQFERDSDEQSGYRHFVPYSGVRGSRRFFKGDLELSLQILTGFERSLTWVQPHLSWKMSANSDLSLFGDFIRGSRSMTDGYRNFLDSQSRVMFWLSTRI